MIFMKKTLLTTILLVMFILSACTGTKTATPTTPQPVGNVPQQPSDQAAAPAQANAEERAILDKVNPVIVKLTPICLKWYSTNVKNAGASKDKIVDLAVKQGECVAITVRIGYRNFVSDVNGCEMFSKSEQKQACQKAFTKSSDEWFNEISKIVERDISKEKQETMDLIARLK